MNRILSLLLFFLAALTMSAATATSTGAASSRPTKETADSLYEAKEYSEAAHLYGAIADSVESADIYYNLGNAEYREKRYAQAVLAYLRALRANPGHDDARYNLAVVRTRLADRFGDRSEMFFVARLRDYVTTTSVERWVIWSFFWLQMFFVGLTVYFIFHRLWVRKTGFFTALFCALFLLATISFALVQRYRYNHNDDAVILAEQVQLYSSPSTSSKKVRVVHEGATVTVLDQTTKGWLQVALPDGSEAYMPDKDYERVVK